MDPTKIYLAGGWGYGNHGDNAILAGTQRALRLAYPNHALTISSYSQAELKIKHGLVSIPSLHKLLTFTKLSCRLRWQAISAWRRFGVPLPRSIARHLESMRDADLIVFGGGGYFNDSWTDALPARLFELELAAASGTPFIILGQTVGPFSKQNAEGPLRQALKSCRFVAYRDLQSASILRTAGVELSKCKYSADLAHLIETTPKSHTTNEGDRPAKIGLMLQKFRRYEDPQGFASLGKIRGQAQYQEALKYIITCLRKFGNVEFVLIASTTWDQPLLNDIAAWMRQSGIMHTQPDLVSTPVEAFVSACQSVDVMLSTNMHPIILASLKNIPSIALSYHFKLTDYMERIGRSTFCHQIDGFQPDTVIDQVIESISHSEADFQRLRSNMEKIKLDAFSNVEVLTNATADA